jgi:hypothetical protein
VSRLSPSFFNHFLDIETGYLETWNNGKTATNHYTTGRSAECRVIALSPVIDILHNAHSRSWLISLSSHASRPLARLLHRGRIQFWAIKRPNKQQVTET